MPLPTLPSITPQTITTDRLTTRVLFSGPEDGIPVLFLHGNTTSATWWEEVLATLPAGFRGIALDQRGFGDAEFEKKIDATRGAGDWADDAAALLDTLGIQKAHIVGNSLGGMVVWRMLMDYPDRVLSAVVVDPGSPYGFGGTKDVAGTPCYPDFAGSGGGLANPELVRRLKEGDTSLDSPFSPRSALRTLLVKPAFVPAREDVLVDSMNAMHIGPQDNPGDAVPSANWPFAGPGVWGSANALSPKYQPAVRCLIEAQPKVHVLWMRGSHDLIVSDTASSDPAFLGKLGLIPGWPGDEICPPQPMVSQTRSVLEQYAAAGGSFEEVIIQDAGHTPYLDKLDDFNVVFHNHLRR